MPNMINIGSGWINLHNVDFIENKWSALVFWVGTATYSVSDPEVVKNIVAMLETPERRPGRPRPRKVELEE